ncbi:probable ATP-dependent RNA helicase spindle-E [Leguminivora glycinivorella]|uniref:probable ATP-dependent RNA helicase spindle-E n=1 Tax=Leguminivora glycinivorella TaxID=1035111 RepID=UPI00200FA61F|nr:probable ATP-dependent RNA helicase spindle-E [Leguminivora glycinivorella]
MDELRSFFNDPRPSQSNVVKLKGPLTAGFRITKEDTLNELNRREDHRHSVILSGTDYAREVKEREIAAYLKNETEHDRWDSVSDRLESLEHLSSLGTSLPNIGELTEEAMTEVYSKYSFQMKEDTNNLSINGSKTDILDRIRGFPVVIIEGPTGCGKTTQVPQWILDDCHKHRRACKIIVTQPRRIAAMSIAKRVAQERGWDVGGLVGYQVGLENKTSNDTRISYVTTGVLLQKLVNAKTMNEYTHIILDEVHERGQDMDFLLLVVKKLLYTVSPTVKVILMSATFQTQKFADYFMIPTPRGQHMASCVQVNKKEPMFSVKTFYLDQLSKFGSLVEACTPKAHEPVIVSEMYNLVVKLVNAFEQIDMTEDKITNRSEADLPSVLIFLPGIHEIEEQYDALTDLQARKKISPECARYNWWVLPLHSTITADEQVRVFQRAPPGHRKVILATNIAESSITVPDIKYVIDFCLMKILVADSATNFSTLSLIWASKSNCEQRAGRAGRVRDGRVYRLVPAKFYDKFQQDSPPEIVRCPLERLVLLAKMLDMGPPSDVLALAMDPPEMSNIQRTMLVLKEVGALKKTVDGEWSSSDGDLTYMGRIMARLPLDVKVSKIIILGHIFGCLNDSIVMAAALSVKNVCSSPFRERLNAYNAKLTWADGSTSDCVAYLHIYKVWDRFRQQQFFKQKGNSEVAWARRFYVQLRALRELNDMVRELKHRLSREGIEPPKTTPWARNHLAFVHKMILAGAFYPQYFVQGSQNETRERDALRELGGLDPRTTVYLKNFPDHQPGSIYAVAIRNKVHELIKEEPRVTFDNNSRKVFLTFSKEESNSRTKKTDGDPTIPGQILLAVYKAVKARNLKMDIRIPLLPPEEAKARAEEMSQSRSDVPVELQVPRLPSVDQTYFPLKVVQFTSPGKFWVQYDEETALSEYNQIYATLNQGKLLSYTNRVSPGDLVAAPYDDQVVYRARVQKVLKDMVEIAYIDFGTLARIAASSLRELPRGSCLTTPPLAMQCRLAELAPAPLLDSHAAWSDRALNMCERFMQQPRLIGKIYSVAHGVVSIELLSKGGNESLNKELVKARFAIPCEESYESKLNHDLRQSATALNCELSMTQIAAYNREQMQLAFHELREVDSPDARHCYTDCCLKGPFSPLEGKVHNLMYGSRETQVQIESSSINSVLLDTEPQRLYERLLIAGDVGQSEHSNKLTLRHTTLMPNVPGLPAIIALLFCPTAELRRGQCGARYSAALCGLGAAANGAPLFPEHDLLVNVDADLDTEDVSNVRTPAPTLSTLPAHSGATPRRCAGWAPPPTARRCSPSTTCSSTWTPTWTPRTSATYVLLHPHSARCLLTAELLRGAVRAGRRRQRRAAVPRARPARQRGRRPGHRGRQQRTYSCTHTQHVACSQRSYSAALCGLGAAANGAPLFPEHDLLVNVDADLDTEDVSNVRTPAPTLSTLPAHSGATPRRCAGWAPPPTARRCSPSTTCSSTWTPTWTPRTSATYVLLHPHSARCLLTAELLRGAVRAGRRRQRRAAVPRARPARQRGRRPGHRGRQQRTYSCTHTQHVACSQRSYSAALCGLGAAANGAPLFPEHDLLVNVDADLDTEDVSNVRTPAPTLSTLPAHSGATPRRCAGWAPPPTARRCSPSTTCSSTWTPTWTPRTSATYVLLHPHSARCLLTAELLRGAVRAGRRRQRRAAVPRARPARQRGRRPGHRGRQQRTYSCTHTQHVACSQRSYSAALCGLGAAANGAPLFPEHDLLVNVDADLDTEDVSNINHIRYLMDYSIYCREGQDTPAIEDEAREKVPSTIKEILFKLMEKRRKHREQEAIPNAWEWNSVPEDELLEIAAPELTACATAYPLHSPQELRPIPREQLDHLKQEVDKLRLLVDRSSISTSTELSCPLCGTPPMPTHAMRIHLHSNSHKEKEEDFAIFNS